MPTTNIRKCRGHSCRNTPNAAHISGRFGAIALLVQSRTTNCRRFLPIPSRRIIGSLKIHAVPARHNSSRGWRDFNKTLWAGYIIQTPQHTIYFSGDSSYGKHYQQIHQRFPKIDLALIENGQYNENWRDNHMHPEETAQAAADLRAQRFMPIHWGMFSLAMHPWNESVRRSIPLIRAQNIATLTPTLGQVFTLDTPTDDWWEHVK